VGVTTESAIGAAARAFAVEGEFISAERYGNGHIHETYRVTVERNGRALHLLLQRINTTVFARPVELMENIERVTAHVAACVANDVDRERRAMQLIPAINARSWYVDEQGAYWRMYRFVEGARSVELVESAEQCFEVARAFGRFQQQLASMPGPRLHDTIPDFHNTPKRLAKLDRAIAADEAARVKFTGPEIEFVLKRRQVASVLQDAGLPERVTHNDTKINNVLLDEKTDEAVCVIDLDTVMPGLAVYDFGDMVRTATCAAAEDERDLKKVWVRFEYFEALTCGYFEGAGAMLNVEEKKGLVASGKLIVFEQAIRFLTDYLEGDRYYKVSYGEQNLARCRTQLKLLESIEAQEHHMNRLVRSLV